jgi:hypothetical protein
MNFPGPGMKETVVLSVSQDKIFVVYTCSIICGLSYITFQIAFFSVLKLTVNTDLINSVMFSVLCLSIHV